MTETVVGIRELKARLSTYIRQVRGGGTIVITDRGTPVGRIVPLSASVETRVQQLIEAGFATWSGRKLVPSASVAQTQGQRSVSDLLLEDRE